jgi:hypothetical protein
MLVSAAWMQRSSTCRQTVSLGEIAAMRSIAGFKTAQSSHVAVELPAAMPRVGWMCRDNELRYTK